MNLHYQEMNHYFSLMSTLSRMDHYVKNYFFVRLLNTDAKGESVYQIVVDYFQKKMIPLDNIISCATDCVPWTSAWISKLDMKKSVPGILTVQQCYPSATLT